MGMPVENLDVAVGLAGSQAAGAVASACRLAFTVTSPVAWGDAEAGPTRRSPGGPETVPGGAGAPGGEYLRPRLRARPEPDLAGAADDALGEGVLEGRAACLVPDGVGV